MRLYIIEKRDRYNGCEYRFRSMVNSCIGAWCFVKDDAIKDGKQHHEIMIKIYPQLEEV